MRMFVMISAGLLATSAVANAAGRDRPPITGVSHIAVYAADAMRSEHFYVHDLGALRGNDPESARGVRYYFAATQFVEVLPVPAGPASINRLDHIAFATPDAEGMRSYLGVRGIIVPKRVTRGSEGSQWFAVNDPEGNKVEFVQPSPRGGPAVPPNPLSDISSTWGSSSMIEPWKMPSIGICWASGPIGSVGSRKTNRRGSPSRCRTAPIGWNTCSSTRRMGVVFHPA